MRIYPFALRVASSNPDPPFYWRRGAQLVALNWQNLDKGMMLNNGMFSGSQGWELKPTGYRSTEPSSTVTKRQTLDLAIEVFAAQDLALPPGDHREKGFRPYLNCQLHVEEPDSEAATGQDDISSDSEKTSYKLCTKSASGKNPDFGAQKLAFPTVTGIVEELSFIRSVSFLFSSTMLFNTSDKQSDPCITEFVPDPHDLLCWGYCFFRACYTGIQHMITQLPDSKGNPSSSHDLCFRCLVSLPRLITDSLRFIRFKIKDDEIGRDELAGWTCIRLDRLREGYRLVHLHDCIGEKTGGVLLVNITKRFS